MKHRLLSPLLAVLLAVLAGCKTVNQPGPYGSGHDDSNTVNTLPTAGASSFASKTIAFLKKEEANRLAEFGAPFQNFVSVVANASSCLGVARAGLTMTPTACVAYNAGYRGTDTHSITFPDASSCWVAMDENTVGSNAGLGNFTRVTAAHYLIDCIDAAQPAMVADSQLLMKVITAGGAVTAVTDLRTTVSINGGGGGGGGGGAAFPLLSNVSGAGHNISNVNLPNSSVNNVQTVTAPPYNADPTGVASSSTAIASAMAAACAFGSVPAPVYFPNGTYKLTQPLIDSCSNNALTLLGDNYNTNKLQVSGFTGPAILIATDSLIKSLNSGVITAAPLVGGTGASLFFASGVSPMWLDLQEDLGSLLTPFLSGKSAMTARTFFKTGASTVFMSILSSSGSVDYGSCSFQGNIGTVFCTGAYALWVGTDNKLHGYVTTSVNGLQYVTSTGTVPLNAVNEADLEYDGTHIGVALNGTWGPLVVATGTVVQRNDEVTTLGAMMSGWPHLHSASLYFQGSLFDPEIANVTRRTLGTNYTQDAAAFTFDSHTGYGSTFANAINMPGTSSPVLFSADYFNGAATTTTWASIHNGGAGCCGGHYNIDNLTIAGGTIGIEVADADVTLDHIQLSVQSYMGVNTSPNATFNSDMDDIVGLAGSSEMGNLVLEGGISSAKRVRIGACGKLCDYINNGSLSDSYIAAASNTQWGLVVTSQGLITGVELDNENGGTCAGALFEVDNQVSGRGNFTVIDSTLTDCGSGTPPMTIEGSVQLTLIGNQLTWQGQPSAVVHVGGGFPAGTVVFQNNTLTSSPNIPLADYPVGPASIPTISMGGLGCRGTVTLAAGAGTFSSSCISASNVCQGQDTTTVANTFVLAPPTAGRTTLDGVTNTDTSLVSATLAFVAGDVGRQVFGSGIFAGSTITSVTNGTTVVLSHVTTATATGVTVTLAPSAKITAGTGTDQIAVNCQ
jgi:Pectate lyase superfamily protein